MTVKNPPEHPGAYVKENVLPEGMAVKKAAELMGIGRPALSNFLNGNANLSQNMATRLAKTFGADKAALLNLQQEYSSFLSKEDENRIAVRSYAPSFLCIRADHIDTWADKIEARSLLAALLRRLVNSTGSEITHSDFPAYDNSQRHGWDGHVDSNNATPWVPVGISGWEFGCTKNPSKKANDDYATRTKNVPKTERENTIFVFVTPRNWKEKNDWVTSKKEENEWKDVRAYDANDLEQWLEHSASGQVWLAERIGITREGCEALDDYWSFWSNTASPPISRKIFDSAVAAHSETLIKWYQNPATKPFVITAGSKEEALAFIASATSSLEELQSFSEQAVLVSNAETSKRLAIISKDFIPIAHTSSAETELVISFNNRHSIIVAEKNLKGMEPDIVVDLPSYESFRDALTEMGFDDAQIEIHSSQSGKSPTILRRQLATIPTLKMPNWATTNSNIRLMIPLVLAGTWKSDQEGDKEILRNLSDIEYPDIEKNVAYLANLDDAPIWIEGKYRGTVSKLDCFHAISDQITEDDITKFFFIAEYVLCEDDPSLDLDKDKRWAANIYDKVRDHSSAIRESICETLIIMSIHGDGLFGKRLGISIKVKVTLLIRKLLGEQDERVWQSQQGDLPRYAEAAPDEFLDIIEDELLGKKPAFSLLFEPVDGGMFSRCERTGMLWALELLAWKPSRLSRVTKVLAQLCEYNLDDNRANKPIGSLNDILLSWKPHTAATLEQRCDVLELLCHEYPNVGWDICMQQLKPGSQMTSGTYRPRWRSGASGAGQTVTRKDVFDFRKKCQNLALAWSVHTQNTLADLIDCLSGMENKDRKTVTAQITTWLESSPSDDDVIKLREHVRRRTMTHRVRRQKSNNASNYVDGKKIYDLLEPQEVILKHQWLFSKQWVAYSPEELDADDLDFHTREEKLSKQRTAALREIIKIHGTNGVIELCLKGDAGSSIGWILGRDILNKKELQVFAIKCLTNKSMENSHRIGRCLSGLLRQLDDKEMPTFLRELIEQIMKDSKESGQLNQLFLNSPFTKTSWNLLQEQDKEIQKMYWSNVYPQWGDQSPEDLNFIVDQLMKANRPRAAFDIAHLSPGRIESTRLIKLLSEAAINNSEPKEHFRVSTYEIEQALKSLNQRDDVDRMELVRLEYLYVEVLTPTSEYGISNLSKEIAKSPLSFMQMLVLCFRRDDLGSDSDEWQLPKDAKQRQSMASSAYAALEHANVIPGSQDDGSIDIDQLRNWINEVRTLAKGNGRTDIADQRIGQILSKSSIGSDDIWPRIEVRQVFEEIASKEISTGMEIGLRNSRGAGFRPEDGAPERGLAKKYRDFAGRVMNATPFVSRMLLRIAESYEHDADWYDSNDRVRRRLRG